MTPTNTINMRHRTLSVVLLSVISMLGCMMWWGRLSLSGGTSTTSPPTPSPSEAPVVVQVQNQSEDAGLTQQQQEQEAPPPFLFQSSWYAADDDESEFTGDDDNVKQGERIRGKTTPKKKKKKPVRATSIDASLETASDAPNNFDWENYKTRPKIVWLMSYPNSGTSYTMTMVSRASGKATASNYGREVAGQGETNTPLYPGQWNGPYYRPEPRKPLPEDYILVKTHCGGRCVTCGPDKYVLNETEFLDECRRGSGFFGSSGRRRLEQASDDDSSFSSGDLPTGSQTVHYDYDLVKKAIHLYRNPFHNIVSRFHLERKHWVQHEKKYQVDRYSNDATGFQRWCRDLNKQYGPSISTKQKKIPADVVELMQAVPCHGEMYRYAQWHNMAHAVTTHAQKPTLTLHYENYDKKWNATTTTILDFLHLDFEGEKKDFSARHDYAPYFTSKQRNATKAMMQQVVSESVWKQVERYFKK